MGKRLWRCKKHHILTITRGGRNANKFLRDTTRKTSNNLFKSHESGQECPSRGTLRRRIPIARDAPVACKDELLLQCRPTGNEHKGLVALLTPLVSDAKVKN